ncbi:MAG: hypothetical protein OJF49_001848 [Ktedonobacterales bacterium]|nr:MAG: hypothetical protein OJF49_001848 [Ktedonobacterales bacterium]
MWQADKNVRPTRGHETYYRGFVERRGYEKTLGDVRVAGHVGSMEV